jgi:HAD superfamily hydrolase (TIGR01662 family)
MTAPLVVLDIGSSLVDGPAHGPAARIAEAVGLNDHHKRALHQLLMTTDYAGPSDVCAAMREHLELVGPTVESAVADVWAAQESEARLIPGAFDALQALAARGYRLALLSNIWTPYLRSVRQLLGEFFDAHIPAELQLLSCREGLAKPALELFNRLLERAGADPERTLMVGDSYGNDVEPAAACGMRTLWLLHDPVGETPALVKILNGVTAAPTLTLRSLADVDFEGAWLSQTLAGSTATD